MKGKIENSSPLWGAELIFIHIGLRFQFLSDQSQHGQHALCGRGATHPTTEGTSNRLIQLFGQASVVSVYIMDALKTPEDTFTTALLLSVELLLLSTFLIIRMKDPVSSLKQ